MRSYSHVEGFEYNFMIRSYAVTVWKLLVQLGYKWMIRLSTMIRRFVPVHLTICSSTWGKARNCIDLGNMPTSAVRSWRRSVFGILWRLLQPEPWLEVFKVRVLQSTRVLQFSYFYCTYSNWVAMVAVRRCAVLSHFFSQSFTFSFITSATWSSNATGVIIIIPSAAAVSITGASISVFMTLTAKKPCRNSCPDILYRRSSTNRALPPHPILLARKK